MNRGMVATIQAEVAADMRAACPVRAFFLADVTEPVIRIVVAPADAEAVERMIQFEFRGIDAISKFGHGWQVTKNNNRVALIVQRCRYAGANYVAGLDTTD